MYVTLIYCFEGSLMELYMEEGTGLAPEDGMELLELSYLDLSVSENGGWTSPPLTGRTGGRSPCTPVPAWRRWVSCEGIGPPFFPLPHGAGH